MLAIILHMYNTVTHTTISDITNIVFWFIGKSAILHLYHIFSCSRYEHHCFSHLFGVGDMEKDMIVLFVAVWTMVVLVRLSNEALLENCEQ